MDNLETTNNTQQERLTALLDLEKEGKLTPAEASELFEIVLGIKD